jgi:CO/xanthine dehydrogenase Mo-binding subunit
MGEAAHFPMAPAILAALHDACGVWVNDLPAKPERVLAALKNTVGSPNHQKGRGR